MVFAALKYIRYVLVVNEHNLIMGIVVSFLNGCVEESVIIMQLVHTIEIHTTYITGLDTAFVGEIYPTGGFPAIFTHR